jgi:hypothetical protein
MGLVPLVLVAHTLILATWKAEVGESPFEGSPGK